MFLSFNILAEGGLRLRCRAAVPTPKLTVIRPVESAQSAANGLGSLGRAAKTVFHFCRTSCDR